MKKLALVVQRYGLEVNGGAELLMRQMAEHLNGKYDVEVLTTKAVDYLTWKDEYEKNNEVINGVLVRRFGVKKPRSIKRFGHLSMLIDKPFNMHFLEDKWVDSQGPYCPELIEYIKANKDKYDVFVFMTYLYYTTVRGIKEVADKSILIPTAHDEPTIYYDVYKDVFTKPSGIFYCTVTEKNFVENKFHNENIINNGGFGGAGIELPSDIEPYKFKKERGIDNYIVYVGRIDTHKGCQQLFEYFIKYKQEKNNDVKLVLMGKTVMEIPERDDIISLGFVSEELKYNVMAGADALIMPSEFESLSIVVLESLALGVPVIVNGLCEVLKQHCVISRAGTYYTNYDKFANQLDDMVCDGGLREEMGKLGVQYVDRYYRWDKIIDSFSQMVEKVSDKAERKE